MDKQNIDLLIRLWNSNLSIASIIKMIPEKENIIKTHIADLRAKGILLDRKKSTKESLVLEYQNGETNPYEIAEKYNLSICTVRQYLGCAGLKRKRPSKNYKKREKVKMCNLSEKTKTIINALNSKKSLVQIAKENNVSKQYVAKVRDKYVVGDMCNE